MRENKFFTSYVIDTAELTRWLLVCFLGRDIREVQPHVWQLDPGQDFYSLDRI